MAFNSLIKEFSLANKLISGELRTLGWNKYFDFPGECQVVSYFLRNDPAPRPEYVWMTNNGLIRHL
jgi:hypothetical protein